MPSTLQPYTLCSMSFDRSLDNDNVKVSISIVAPDIRCIDMSAEWQGRPAKFSLI